MKIQVEMTAEEFQEFFAWRKDKEQYNRALARRDSKLEDVYDRVLRAMEQDREQLGEVKIIDQKQAAELVEMSIDWFT